MTVRRLLTLLAVLAGLTLVGGVVWQQVQGFGGQGKAARANGGQLSAAAAPPAPSQPAAPPTAATLPAAAPPPTRPDLGSSQYRELNLAALTQTTPVFTYHDIIRDRRQKGAVWFDCTQAEFEEQMSFLSAQGATVITLAQLQAHLTLGTPLPPRSVALTFDDSYQGFFDLAYPVLRRYGYPAAVFVHTDYVGVQTGDHPKMSWDELLELDRGGLVTIGAHTRSHPADLATLSVTQQDDELRGSKAVLEARLGHPVNFTSYANGKGDATTFERARLAGYTLGFLEFWGSAEQSPGIMQLNRYIHIQMPRGWNEAYGPDALPAAVTQALRRDAPVTAQEISADGVRIALQSGGQLRAVQTGTRAELAALLGRMPPDAVPLALSAGMLDSQGQEVGPVLTPGSAFRPASRPDAEPAPADAVQSLQGRPLLLWSASELAILPYAAPLMDNEAALRAFMPDLSGALLANTWLVHGGAALSAAALEAHPTGDGRRARQRAFLGIDEAGSPVIGLTLTPVPLSRLAGALATLKLREAMLLDPGFSAALAQANSGRRFRPPALPAGPLPSSVLLLQ
ncbi:polysaccharide deacetylase family protein [Deinococcus sp.]|uniref:polysaccharide deacetylase family protein n=1 Tax=Deinococcus sp. TaxID=47478 RepID=UPI003CC67EE2